MGLLDLPSGGAASCGRRVAGNRAVLDSSALIRILCRAAVVAGTLLPAAPAGAGGFWVYEMGTPDLGTASAGRAALAADAATVFGNPAGMTRLDRSQLLIGTQLVVGDVHFNADSGTTVPGGNGGNASGLVPGGSLYYAQSVTPDFKLGFWSGSYLGGSLKYEDGWSGRYYSTESDLITLGAGVNAAYKVNDWLSIGGGPFALYGKLEQKVALNNVLGGGQDGSLKYSDTEPGVGGMAGVMLEPWEGTRFGVTYISPVKFDFKDVPSTNNLGPIFQALQNTRGLFTRQTKIELTLPQQVMVSGYQKLTDSWSVMGNLVWQNWSQFGEPEISVASTSANNVKTNLNYDDSWGFALGAQYAFADGWLWSVGGAFDTSPMSKSERSPAIPMDQQYRLGTGVQYSFNDNITVGVAYEYMNGGDNNIDRNRGPLAGRLQGDYKSFDFHFIALNLIWRL
jgi:long-chain fatty acid transport protein